MSTVREMTIKEATKIRSSFLMLFFIHLTLSKEKKGSFKKDGSVIQCVYKAAL